MNAGAYGREVADILVSATVVLRSGEVRTLMLDEIGYTYRHSDLPEGAIVVAATFAGVPGRNFEVERGLTARRQFNVEP